MIITMRSSSKSSSSSSSSTSLQHISSGSTSSNSFSRCRTRRRWCLSRRSLLYLLFLLLLLPFASSKRVLQDSGNPRGIIGLESEQISVQGGSVPVVIPHRSLQDKVKLTPKPRGEVAEKNKSRRDLSGLGSSPPQCNSKCGYCTPCKAVHVPIQPGLVRTTEYYPEAWRCKCGNKLYMP